MITRSHVRKMLALAVFGAGTSGAFAAGGQPREAGIWYDDSGKGAVKIEMCGAKLCGKIYWLKDQLNAEGKPLVDRHNPNEAERKRPICGLQVIGGLAAMDDGSWDTGWIYDPKEGKSYSVALAMTAPDTLKVTGYLVMKMMGRTLTWKKAPEDLPACTQNAAAPAPAPAAAAGKAAAGATAAGTSKAGAAAPPAAKPAAAAQKGAAGETLPWADKKAPAGSKPAAEASKLGGTKPPADGKPSTAKKAVVPAEKAVTPRRSVEPVASE